MHVIVVARGVAGPREVQVHKVRTLHPADATRAAFERDRRRDAELQARGYSVLRVTWRQLTEEPAAVIALVSAALARR